MRRAYVVIGLSHGDEGKGGITDMLTRDTGSTLVVRHNGGAQAAHNVVTDDGRHHTFSQWGAGTFAGARTFLSRFMIVSPLAMVPEAEHLKTVGIKNPWDLLTVDGRALVITPFHRAMNRLRELDRGDDRHGTCGVGVGPAYELRHKTWSMRFADLRDPFLVEGKLEAMAAWFAGEFPNISMGQGPGELKSMADKLSAVAHRVEITSAPEEEDVLRRSETIIFEGAQGMLIDRDCGTQPHTSWTNAGPGDALEMMKPINGPVYKVGVVRAYATRHGAGPLPTYDAALTAALKDDYNFQNEWQGEFRCGWFDADATRYAIRRIPGGIDHLAVTCLDRIESLPKKRMFRYDGRMHDTDTRGMAAVISESIGMRVGTVSHGPRYRDKTGKL